MDYEYSFELQGQDLLIVVVSLVFGLAVTVFYVYCMWRIFAKAGEPGWASLIPVYNTLVQLQVIQRPWWWLLLMLVPGVNFVIAVVIVFDLAKVFGKENGFAIGLLFLAPIFIPIMALGDAEYVGRLPAGETG